MNIDLIKEEIAKNINRKVHITVYGLRNKINRYDGRLYRIYPNLFSIMTENGEKSFSYNEYIIGEVKITYI